MVPMKIENTGRVWFGGKLGKRKRENERGLDGPHQRSIRRKLRGGELDGTRKMSRSAMGLRPLPNQT